MIRSLILERIKTDAGFHRLHPNKTDEEKVNIFRTGACSADPTRSKKYAVWIVESYLDKGIRSFEDLARVKDNLQLFEQIRKSQKDAIQLSEQHLLDIVNYCGLIGCSPNQVARSRPFATTQTAKLKRNDRIGIETALDPYRERSTHEEPIYDRDIIYTGLTATVVKPTTEASAVYWGRGTR